MTNRVHSQLIRVGDDLALVLPADVLASVGIDDTTSLDVRTQGGKIVIEPAKNATHTDRVRAAVEGVNERFEHDLRKLAE
ncbi:MAG: AbrB/MazE/SpoVT family DNA-binding domain-containing protein [Planctomycetota bacterium]